MALIAFCFGQASKAEPLLIDGKPSHKEPLALLKKPEVLKGSVQKKTSVPDLKNSKILDGKAIKGVLDNQAFRLPRPGTGTSPTPLNGLIKGSEKPFPPFSDTTSLLTPRADSSKSLTGVTSTAVVPTAPEPTKKPLESHSGAADHSGASSNSRASRTSSIIVRLVYHELDQKNAFNAIRFAQSMRTEHGANVTILLEKEGARIANKHLITSYIFPHEQQARTVPGMLRAFIEAGGRVIVSKAAAEDHGLDGNSLIQGVEVVSDRELGEEIINCNKILEY